jgi:hypothetical protein
MEPIPKAAKKWIPKEVPRISTEVLRANCTFSMGWRVKLKKKKIKAIIRRDPSLTKAMRKTKGKAVAAMIRRLRSK